MLRIWRVINKSRLKRSCFGMFRDRRKEFDFLFFYTSRKHLRTKHTPELHLTYMYGKNGGDFGLVQYSTDEKW